MKKKMEKKTATPVPNDAAIWVERKLAKFNVAYATQEYLSTHDPLKEPSHCHWIGWDNYVKYPEWVRQRPYSEIPIRGRINNDVL